MDKEALELYLVQSEEHVARVEQHIARQRNILTAFERDGHAKMADVARFFLAKLVRLQVFYIEDRDRLKKQLMRVMNSAG